MKVRTIEIKDSVVEYSLRKRRGQRSYTLSVHAGGRVTLTVPKSASIRSAEKFLQQKSAWLKRTLERSPQTDYMSERERKKHYVEHKEDARKLIHERLRELNTYYNLRYRRVSVRANRTRWGSCSEHGNLNFDYRILFLPEHVQDYLITHELCHLQEMNHSEQFWALVAETVPNYKEVRKELRKHSL